ncbi:MAG: hypothetical protein HYX93_04645 [Chloroflexi bacterium]|nr:hypothetical protein [Chloroflexota bacterium]
MPSGSSRIAGASRLSASGETPQDDRVYMLGNTPELGEGDPSRALEMTRVTESLWYVSVPFNSVAEVSYRFLRGASRIDDGQERTLEVAYGGQQVLAWVASWQDQEASTVSPRPTFMAGAALLDFWSDEFKALMPTTLDHLKSQGVEWVDVSQIWNYGRLFPEPILENRSLQGGMLLTPMDDMRFIASEIKARGMKLLIHAQANAEMTAEAEHVFDPHSDEWYEAYFVQFERFMLDVAAMAQEVGADMVAVPRVMAVFQNPGYEATYNARMAEIILKMRALYDGLITSETGAPGSLQFDFHRLLDFQGVYWFEPLDVADDAPVEELQAALEARLDGFYLEVYQRYGKPLVIMQFAYGSYAGAARMAPGGNSGDTEDQPVALDLLAQARLYEAFFRAIASRPWVAGVFPFGYHLLDLPLDRDFSMRTKPAEAVAARWYELLSP